MKLWKACPWWWLSATAAARLSIGASWSTACCPVSVAQLEKLGEEIEQELQNSLEREISTEHVGELVMDKLKGVDEVAYVRFASVYRQFKDINTFMRELNKLLDEDKH